MKPTAPSLALLAVVACTSSPYGAPDGNVDVTGTLGTLTFAGMNNALAAVVHTPANTGAFSPGTVLELLLTDGPDCAAVTAGDTVGASYLDLLLYGSGGVGSDGITGPAAPTAPGTFYADELDGPPWVSASAERLGSGCWPVDGGAAESGAVAVTSLGGDVVGSFALSDGAGGDATGTFYAAACPGLQARIDAGGSAACR